MERDLTDGFCEKLPATEPFSKTEASFGWHLVLWQLRMRGFMIKAQHTHLILLWLLSVLATAGCRLFLPGRTSVDSEEIPQTGPRHQGNAGFCWAYANQAFIESFMLARKGIEIDLSEEMFAFYRTARDLFDLTQAADGDTIWPERSTCEQIDVLNLGFNVAKDFGVIPESAWSVKFNDSTGLNADAVHSNIKS